MSYEEKIGGLDFNDFVVRSVVEVIDLGAEADKEIAKHVEINRLLAESNIELKANNDRLREHIRQGMEPAEHNYECEVYMEECWAVLEETLAQSLREIEANAIEKFVMHAEMIDISNLNLEHVTEEYVSKLREES